MILMDGILIMEFWWGRGWRSDQVNIHFLRIIENWNDEKKKEEEEEEGNHRVFDYFMKEIIKFLAFFIE